MNTLAKLLLVGACALTLAGCGTRDDAVVDGGGIDGGETDGGGVSSPGVTGGDLKVRVLSDANRIETGSSDVANISALVSDVDNNAVANQSVSFSASGGVLQEVSETTDENGTATATLRLLQDFRSQDITVTVTAGDASGEALVSADGSELEVGGPTNLIEGASAGIVAVLKAGNGEPIVNEAVSVESVAGNTVTPAVAMTDIDGRIEVEVDSANGDDTVRLVALDGTVKADHAFTVSTDTLVFSGIDIDTEFEVGIDHDVTVRWTSGGVPVEGRELRFATTAGSVVGARLIATDANGESTVRLRSNSAGIARLTVEAAEGGGPSAHADVEFAASAPENITIDGSSTRVSVLGTSTVTARVTDANGNPVKGTEVTFSSEDLKGGQLNPASATSGSDGEASVTFAAGDEATETDEIVVTAEIEGSTPKVGATMKLSVVQRVLNVTLGTANKVAREGEGAVQYWLNFVVQVADGSGAPLSGADVDLSIEPLFYVKGMLSRVDEDGNVWTPGDDDWKHAGYALHYGQAILCEAEDIREDYDSDPTNNGNGNRLFELAEDRNGNGTLDPQDPASLVASTDGGEATLNGGSLTTDDTGSGYFRMMYPASSAQWAKVRITARARDLGEEAIDSFETGMPMIAEELNQTQYTPPNFLSPHGVVLDCTDVN